MPFLHSFGHIWFSKRCQTYKRPHLEPRVPLDRVLGAALRDDGSVDPSSDTNTRVYDSQPIAWGLDERIEGAGRRFAKHSQRASRSFVRLITDGTDIKAGEVKTYNNGPAYWEPR